MSEASPAAAVDVQRMMVYQLGKKSVGLAYALWFFTGWLGGHRFYLNRPATAMMMAFTTLLSTLTIALFVGFLGFACLGIWALVDAFRLAGWVRKHNRDLMAGVGG